MKYLEQRIEKLEKDLIQLANDTSRHLNNYVECPPNPIRALSNSATDDTSPNPNYADSSDHPEYYPHYPDVIGSWDDGVKSNNEEPVITSWGFVSDFDKQDKDFLRSLNSTEKIIEKDFGKIISKFRILHHEWEMDGYGYIVKDLEYNKKAIVTNHGKPMVVNKSYLNDIISRYKEIIQETQRALFLINE
jgi:hypothetical protein